MLKPLSLALLLALGATLPAVAAPALETAPAEQRTLARQQVFDALIEAVNRTTLSAQTSGQLLEVNFDVDDQVEKGMVLVRIRDTEQRAALDAAEARYTEAQVNFKRAREMRAKQLAPEADYDKAEAALKAAKAQLEQAQAQLEYTALKAPYSGIVLERHVQPGEMVNPGVPVMTGISLDNLRAVARVPQQHIATIRALGKAQVLLGDQVVEGATLTISPYADPNTHTFFVRVDLPEGTPGLYPGMFAKVAFAVGERERLLIPASAVAYRSEVTAAYVVAPDGRIAMRQLRLGAKQADGTIEVLAGLAPGEQVALDPARATVALKEQRAAKAGE